MSKRKTKANKLKLQIIFARSVNWVCSHLLFIEFFQAIVFFFYFCFKNQDFDFHSNSTCFSLLVLEQNKIEIKINLKFQKKKKVFKWIETAIAERVHKRFNFIDYSSINARRYTINDCISVSICINNQIKKFTLSWNCVKLHGILQKTNQICFN